MRRDFQYLSKLKKELAETFSSFYFAWLWNTQSTLAGSFLLIFSPLLLLTSLNLHRSSVLPRAHVLGTLPARLVLRSPAGPQGKQHPAAPPHTHSPPHLLGPKRNGEQLNYVLIALRRFR